MQIKLAAYLIVFTCLVYPLKGKPIPRKGCYECEEEVWETVPCKSIPPKAVTSSTTTTTTTTTQRTPRITRPTATPSTAQTPEYTTPQNTYKKCYCECKLGCKEFCRKVVANPSEKQIVQVSKITEPNTKGRIVLTHILQRELIPKSEKSYDNYKTPDIDETIIEDYTTLAPYPVTEESSCEEEPEDKPSAHEALYYKKPKDDYNKPIFYPPIDPIYGSYAASDQSVNKKLLQFDAFLSATPQQHQQPGYFRLPHLKNGYEFSVPFENSFSKVTKTILEPSLNSPAKLSTTALGQYNNQYNNILDPYLRNTVSSSPSNQIPYSKPPYYAVSYNGLQT